MAPRTAQRAGGKLPETTNPPYTAAGRGGRRRYFPHQWAPEPPFPGAAGCAGCRPPSPFRGRPRGNTRAHSAEGQMQAATEPGPSQRQGLAVTGYPARQATEKAAAGHPEPEANGEGRLGLLARNWPGNSAAGPAAAEMEETDFPPPAGKECLPVQNRAYRKNITQIII